ncbi:MAG: hypothetical protein LBS88_05230 [Tannerellaceae bacterium]|jgi:hypothetical protein|nr:hypothetical protein [Tannerellaceae bacterium]
MWIYISFLLSFAELPGAGYDYPARGTAGSGRKCPPSALFFRRYVVNNLMGIYS